MFRQTAGQPVIFIEGETSVTDCFGWNGDSDSVAPLREVLAHTLPKPFQGSVDTCATDWFFAIKCETQ